MDNRKIEQVKDISRRVKDLQKAKTDRVINKDSTSIWRCPVCWSIRLLVAAVLGLVWFLLF